MINVNAGKLLSDRLDQQCGNNGTVYAAREGKQNLFVADLFS